MTCWQSESTYSFLNLGVIPFPFGSSRLRMTISSRFSFNAFSIWMLLTSVKRFMTNRIVGILATNNAFSTSDSISVELKHAIQSFLHRLSVHRNMCSYSLMGVLFEQRKRFFSLFRSSWLPIVSIICIFLQVHRSGMETRWYYFVWVKSLLCSLYRCVFILVVCL